MKKHIERLLGNIFFAVIPMCSSAGGLRGQQCLCRSEGV